VKANGCDSSTLARWRSLDAAHCLGAVADYAKKDLTFKPARIRTPPFACHVAGHDVELLCTGSKFWDTGPNAGRCAVDLVVHLFSLDFKRAVRLLRDKVLSLCWREPDGIGMGHAGFHDPGPKRSRLPIVLWAFDGELRPGQSLPAGVFAARRHRIQAVMASIGEPCTTFSAFWKRTNFHWDHVRGSEESSLVRLIGLLPRSNRARRNTVRQRLIYVCKFYEYA